MAINIDDLKLIGRSKELFELDVSNHESELEDLISKSKFLVIGGAGSIGQAVVKEIFNRNPKALHLVDISENNLVEIVRDIRSSIGYGDGDFRTFAIDCGSKEFELLFNNFGPYDYIFNLSALKHVRSEKDPYTLMRMIKVNILNTLKTVKLAEKSNAKKYFCVSTDKAANPVNMMGASKRIMEMFLMRESSSQKISMARFANVAFSDGSLLHGFNQRIMKNQPFSAPNDVKRYFVTSKEAGELCLLSGLLGENRDIFFPKLSPNLHLMKFSDIAIRYLEKLGYEPHICSSEDEARNFSYKLINENKWPCYFFKSDTTGEKDFEEFYTDNEILDLESYESVGIIKNNIAYDDKLLDYFLDKIKSFEASQSIYKNDIIELFNKLLPEFSHIEKGKFLDQKM